MQLACGGVPTGCHDREGFVLLGGAGRRFHQFGSHLQWGGAGQPAEYSQAQQGECDVAQGIDELPPRGSSQPSDEIMEP